MKYEAIVAQETFLCRQNWEEESRGSCHAESGDGEADITRRNLKVEFIVTCNKNPAP